MDKTISINKFTSYIRTYVVLVNACLILAASLFWFQSSNDYSAFIFSCRFGIVSSVVAVISYRLVSRSFFNPGMLFLLSFIVFQYGIPILAGIVPDYTNWYASHLTSTILTSGSWLSVLCISSFAIGLVLAHGKNLVLSARKRKPAFAFLNNREAITSIALAIFIVSGLIAFYYAINFYMLSSAYDINYAKALWSKNAIINLGMGFFVPSGFVLLAYCKNRSSIKLIMLVLIVYAAITTAAGDRTAGLTLALVLFYYYWISKNKKAFFPKIIILIVAALLFLWILAAVASLRVGGSIEGLSPLDAVVAAFNEMGFNFLTVCFQTQVLDSFNCGLTYITSLTGLIPSSFDVLGLKEFSNVVGVYYAEMANYYPWATFGLGYSLIAESYANFGNFGFIAIAFVGFFFGKLLSIQLVNYNNFSFYLRLVFLYSFITVPRRSMYDAVVAVGYDVVFIFFLLWVGYSLCSSRRQTYVALLD